MKTMKGNIWENLLGTAANDTANKIGNAFGNQAKLKQAQNMQAGERSNALMGSLGSLLFSKSMAKIRSY